jgi:hypothetical protein
MHRFARPSLGTLLLRSGALWGAVFTLSVVTLLHATSAVAPAHREDAGGDTSAWKESYSRRYPGCVSMALWPVDEQPVALVTRGPGGEVRRVPVDRPVPHAGDRPIGACR